MLAWTTYIELSARNGRIVSFISYKRGLLFYYCDVGEFPDALE